MTHQNPNFFTSRSTTKEFLFSHSEDRIDSIQERNRRSDGSKDPIEDLFEKMPDLLDRQQLIQVVETDLASVSKLTIIAFSFVTPDAKSMEKESGSTEETLLFISDFCKRNKGKLAKLAARRLAAVFPHRCDIEGKALAEELMSTEPVKGSPRLFVGVAAYPTIDYTRNQVVENAEKALDHGEFFGPGSVTFFDAVSLNISGDRKYQNGDIAGAIEEFKKGLLIDPKDVNLHNSLGVCYGVNEAYDLALTAFDNAIRLAPQEIMPLYNKGYILSVSGEKEKAMDCFMKANAKESGIFEVVFHIGQTLLEKGKTEKAMFFLKESIKANGRSGPAHKSLGSCLKQLGLYREALRAYKTAVKINPSDAQSLCDLGQLYLTLEESLDVATVFGEQSVRLEPDNGLFRFCLGCIYLHREMLDLALKKFEEAEALGHDSRSKIEEIHQRRIDVRAS
jgi:tetratricopeptide (TPR) repeat protein